jgi:hypothetical protein
MYSAVSNQSLVSSTKTREMAILSSNYPKHTLLFIFLLTILHKPSPPPFCSQISTATMPYLIRVPPTHDHLPATLHPFHPFGAEIGSLVALSSISTLDLTLVHDFQEWGWQVSSPAPINIDGHFLTVLPPIGSVSRLKRR